ncbi:uncharacterized protein LOC119676160 [Teleopsis dalmanni]|uniref:uncharacterized protein LOC119676160 n=1 Tax=Teleopsis dalmanni TaxID=139649 RepID=UPI0018CD1C98|nr:uncharacterized protein LOC119676160 [Teleopsis dalmanni]
MIDVKCIIGYWLIRDNEFCEKIAILRKRRLADKKYEFSEDNSENIIPFTKMRSASKSYSAPLSGALSSTSNSRNSYHRPSPTNYHFHTSPCASPSSSPRPSSSFETRRCTPPPLHRASPISLQQGFRSPPCSSPVSGSIMRSPSSHLPPPHSLSQATQQMLSFKPLGTLSPLQVSMTKRNYMDLSGSMSPNSSVPFLSPRREEYRVVEIPLQGSSMPEKPVCTKKFKRRYVEEDDAASVITSEEDDCISPGYHTSLPVEVHGSCYSEMQMISQTTYQQLCCASVVITQHSFDLEAFSYYVISTLCQKNQKTYDVFYDWAYEIINVCPLSHTIICVLMAQFAATDQLPCSSTNCFNCSRKLDCIYHRHKYECRILFSWNMETGVWDILDYGELIEYKTVSKVQQTKKVTDDLACRAKKIANELSTNLKNIQDYTCNLRVLESDLRKPKSYITDLDNMLEFYLKKPQNNDN